MKNHYRKSLRILPPILLASLGAGLVNGLFGTGGGILILFFLSWLYDNSPLYDKKDLFAMTIGSVFLLSLPSALLYLRSGAFSLSDASPYFLPGMLGGALGAILLGRASPSFLRILFAVLVVWAGATLLLR